MNNYERLNFINGAAPALSADNLNHMEEGIANAFEDIGTISYTKADSDSVISNADGAVKGNNLDTYAVTSLKIADGAVITKKLDMGAVTTVKIANGNITLEKLAQPVVDLINSKANTDDVYLSTEADEHFVPKTNESGGGVVTDYIANKAVTSEKIANNAVGTTAIADNAISNAKLMSNSVSTDKIVDGAVTLAKLGADVNSKFDSKYDAQNIESGVSILTPHSSSADKVKENSCIYEKIGNMCFYNVTVILNAFTMATSSIHLIDLPFRNVGTYSNYIIATSNKGALFKAFVHKDSTWLTITTLTGSSYTVTQDEQITFNFCVKIA